MTAYDDDCICPMACEDHLPECPFADSDSWEEADIEIADSVGMIVQAHFEGDEYRAFSAMMRANVEWHPNRYLKDLAMHAVEEWRATVEEPAAAEAD